MIVFSVSNKSTCSAKDTLAEIGIPKTDGKGAEGQIDEAPQDMPVKCPQRCHETRIGMKRKSSSLSLVLLLTEEHATVGDINARAAAFIDGQGAEAFSGLKVSVASIEYTKTTLYKDGFTELLGTNLLSREQFDMLSSIAATGGWLGLAFGASVFSFAEMFVYLLMLLAIVASKIVGGKERFVTAMPA